MADGNEIELKLEFDPAAAAALRDHPLLLDAQAATKAQTSVYYDTPKGALRKAGYSLRLRKSGGGYVQTVKQASGAAGLFDRREWELRVSGEALDAGALDETPIGVLIGRDGIPKLRPVVFSRVDRTIWRLTEAGGEVEIALDEGTVAACGEERPLHELEIELKGGMPEAVLVVARKLAERVPLRIGVLSKWERGFALAEGRLDRFAKAEPVTVDREMDVRAGFAAIVNACLRHFRMNERFVIEARDADALHQARVAMRRLRSALSLFGPAIRDDGFVAIREELRWFTNQLGEARNLDVFLTRVEGHDLGDRRALLETARERAYDNVIATLQSLRFRDLMLRLVGWLGLGAWRSRRKAARPLRDFAAARLDRLWEKVTAAGAHLAELDDETRHRLRIDIKKLRYAIEFFAGLFPEAGSTLKRTRSALEDMQESLGHLNDIATSRDLLDRFAPAGFDAEPLAAASPHETSSHIAEAARLFTRLSRTQPFWT